MTSSHTNRWTPRGQVDFNEVDPYQRHGCGINTCVLIAGKLPTDISHGDVVRNRSAPIRCEAAGTPERWYVSERI